MVVTDNLFARKGGKLSSSGNHISQQFRLANGRQNKPVFFEDRRTKLNTTVTRYIFDEDGKMSSSPRSTTTYMPRPNFYKREDGYPLCICAREACFVRCENMHCQWSAYGRVRTQCNYHPTVTFLLDLPQCPQCLGPIREILRLDDCPNVDASCDEDDL